MHLYILQIQYNFSICRGDAQHVDMSFWGGLFVLPQAYSAVAVKPAATGRLLKAGIAVLIAGTLLLLLGAVGAFYFWNNNEKHVKLIFYLHC